MEIREAIDKYLEAEDILYDVIHKIFTPYQDYFNNGHGYVDAFEIDDDSVIIKWEDSWQYGGHDCGSIAVPLDDFCDDPEGWVERKIQEHKDTLVKRKKIEETETEKREKKLLKELKAKYE